MAEKKSRVLYILKYLQEHTDEQHPATITEIVSYLSDEGITAGRRTIPNDIDELMKNGFDIVKVKSKQNQYFMGSRHFELPELKLLLDAVYSSKLITPRKSAVLVAKIKELASVYEREEFAEDCFITEMIKPSNESVLINIDHIHTAIKDKKVISFKYFDYLPNKTKVLKNKGEIYRVSPYSLVWNEDKYYVFAHSDKKGKIITFRVDRMTQINVENENAYPCSNEFNVADFCKKVFEMYDGNYEKVILRCKNELMKVIIDKFGEDIETKIINKEWFEVKVDVSVSPIFYGWLFQFTGKMKITSPAHIVNSYKNMLKEAQIF